MQDFEIFKELQTYSNLYTEIERAFYKSALWKAIFAHILDYKNVKLIASSEAFKDYKIVCYRGTGHAISLNHGSLYFCHDTQNDKLINFITFDLSLELENNEGYDCSHQTHSVCFPEELLSNFNQKDFESFVLNIKNKREEALQTKEISLLRELMKKYPQVLE